MSTLGDAADVNPVIKFLPHTLHMCGRNMFTGLTSVCLCVCVCVYKTLFVFGVFANVICYMHMGDRGGTVVKALCYKSEGRWFDSRWCHWNFSLT